MNLRRKIKKLNEEMRRLLREDSTEVKEIGSDMLTNVVNGVECKLVQVYNVNLTKESYYDEDDEDYEDEDYEEVSDDTLYIYKANDKQSYAYYEEYFGYSGQWFKSIDDAVYHFENKVEDDDYTVDEIEKCEFKVED